MTLQYNKVQSAAKVMISRSDGDTLQEKVLSTLKKCSDLVGATLGPGGMSVVIERQEVGMTPIITKDGVTVFRSLGFEDPTKQALLESARDAAIRTASDAGDGTSSCCILSEAITRHLMDYCKKNSHVSPQAVTRELNEWYKHTAEPFLKGIAYRPSMDTEDGRKMLHSVAKVSANSDVALADAVMKCFEIIGSEGNVTISEANGPHQYNVKKIEGYPVPTGFEDSCGPFYQKFINDTGTQLCVLERPTFLLYHGNITDFNALIMALNKVANAVNEHKDIDGIKISTNVVVVAVGFSESVLANLAAGFAMQGTLKAAPLRVPQSPSKTGQFDFLMDLAALTGATILDPMELPLQNFELEHLGVGPKLFEANRFRSSVIGIRDEMLVLERVDQITKQLEETSLSELEKTLFKERLAKLTSGVARLIVQGNSTGEIKERRDRAEDAVCAVRGAIAHGCLPGGGWALSALKGINNKYPMATEIMSKALVEPIYRLFTNAGYSLSKAMEFEAMYNRDSTYDLIAQRSVDVKTGGLLDSLPAVRDAIKNSISIASLLGTCGGVVTFQRDHNLETAEARDTAQFLRDSGQE